MKRILLYLVMVFCLFPLSLVQAADTTQKNYIDDLNAMLAVQDQIGTIYMGMTQEDAEANWENVDGWRLKRKDHNTHYMRSDNVIRPAALADYVKDSPKGSPLIRECFHIGSREGYVNNVQVKYITQYRQVAAMLSNRAVDIFTANYGQPRKESSGPRFGSVLGSTHYDWRPQGRWCSVNYGAYKAISKEDKINDLGRDDVPDNYYIVTIAILSMDD